MQGDECRDRPFLHSASDIFLQAAFFSSLSGASSASRPVDLDVGSISRHVASARLREQSMCLRSEIGIVTAFCSASVRPFGAREARAARRSRHSAGTDDGA